MGEEEKGKAEAAEELERKRERAHAIQGATTPPRQNSEIAGADGDEPRAYQAPESYTHTHTQMQFRGQKKQENSKRQEQRAREQENRRKNNNTKSEISLLSLGSCIFCEKKKKRGAVPLSNMEALHLSSKASIETKH